MLVQCRVSRKLTESCTLQEPEAKGQVVGRMGVGVSSRGAGGLDTAQPVGKAVG